MGSFRRNARFVGLFSVVIAFGVAGQCLADDILLWDDFDSYNAKTWGTMPGRGVSVKDGRLTNKPREGQVYLATVRKYRHVTLEMRVRFNTLSSDSTAFYYLGFQSVRPWAHDLCWLTVQDQQLFAGLRKDGGEGFRKAVAFLESGRWYVLTIVWRQSAVEFLLDNKVVLKSENSGVIPEVRMPVFISANSVRRADRVGAAELEIDWVRLMGQAQRAGSKTQQRQRPATGPRPLFKKRTSTASGSFIKVEHGRAHLENRHYVCELLVGEGVRWNSILNKAAEEQCLAEGANLPVFMLVWKKRLLDSTSFDVEKVDLKEANEKKTLQLYLTCPKPKLKALLQVDMDNTDRMLWSLKLKNKSAKTLNIQPIFPVIGRIDIADNLEDDQYFFPWRSGIVGKVDCDLAYEYGGLAWMQVIAVFQPGLDAGIYTYPLDRNGGFKGLILRKFSPRSTQIVRHSELVAPYEMPQDVFEFDQGTGWAYYYLKQQLSPEGEMVLPETVVSVYSGTWKKPLKRYSRWVHTWYKPLDVPQWFRDCFTFLPRHKPSYYSEKEKKYIGTEQFIGG